MRCSSSRELQRLRLEVGLEPGACPAPGRMPDCLKPPNGASRSKPPPLTSTMPARSRRATPCPSRSPENTPPAGRRCCRWRWRPRRRHRHRPARQHRPEDLLAGDRMRRDAGEHRRPHEPAPVEPGGRAGAAGHERGALVDAACDRRPHPVDGARPRPPGPWLSVVERVAEHEDPPTSTAARSASSCRARGTSSRLQAMQVCPEFRKHWRTPASTASARSASSRTMLAYLPPSSSVTRLTVSAALAATRAAGARSNR